MKNFWEQLSFTKYFFFFYYFVFNTLPLSSLKISKMLHSREWFLFLYTQHSYQLCYLLKQSKTTNKQKQQKRHQKQNKSHLSDHEILAWSVPVISCPWTFIVVCWRRAGKSEYCSILIFGKWSCVFFAYVTYIAIKLQECSVAGV